VHATNDALLARLGTQQKTVAQAGGRLYTRQVCAGGPRRMNSSPTVRESVRESLPVGLMLVVALDG